MLKAMKWQAVLLLMGASAYGATLSASADTEVGCRVFGSPTTTTFTDSSNTNPASASSRCPPGYYTLGSSRAYAAASYGYLSADGDSGNGGGPGVNGLYQAISSFTDSITLMGGSAGATARIEMMLNTNYCAEFLDPFVTGVLQVNGQTAATLSGFHPNICLPSRPVSQSFDVALTPGQPVPFGVTLSACAPTTLGLSTCAGPFSADQAGTGVLSVQSSLTTGITILGGLPAGESLVSQSGFDYTGAPEPGTVALMSAGMLLMWTRRRRCAA